MQKLFKTIAALFGEFVDQGWSAETESDLMKEFLENNDLLIPFYYFLKDKVN